MRLPTTAIGELMTEHRLILRVVDDMSRHAQAIASDREVDPAWVDAVVDFLHNYADRNHHGKEEDILFRKLEDKQMSPEHEDVMRRLIAEHRYAREVSGRMVEATRRYRRGEQEALDEIREQIEALVGFYPRHIEVEDHGFFKPAIEYFTKEEREGLAEEFRQFDRTLLHERYAHLVEELEAGRVPLPSEA